MIDLSDYPIFNNHISTLKDTSLDISSNQPKYMTLSTRSAINFDGVKDEYTRQLNLFEIPKSNDALFDDGKGHLVFVEFKNGLMNRAKQYGVRKKIYDSALIFTDITTSGISYMRANVNYILVYNEAANQNNSSDEDLKQKRNISVQSSASFDSFAKNIGKCAKEEYVCFGLRAFQNYCFKEVHTYTESEFNTYLSTL